MEYECLVPSVQMAMNTAREDKRWTLRFATKDTGFPDPEDSRFVSGIEIDDDVLLETMSELCTSDDECRFCGSIVGQINFHTEM